MHYLEMLTKDSIIPLNLVTIGFNQQPYLNRSVGLPYHQIFLTTEGKGIFRLFGLGDFELLPGEVIIIPSGASHEYFPLTKMPWELGFVGFDGELADTILSQLEFNEPKKIAINSSSIILKNIEQLWLIVNRNEDDAPWRASQNLYSLLLELRKSSKNYYGPKTRHGYQNENIRKIAEFMSTNYPSPLKMSRLSNMAGYSTHHFSRLFKKVYNMTPHQYLENVRFEKARFLLEEDSDIFISEVANKVGMEENYFIRLFKKKYGMTPGAYRMLQDKSKN